MLAPTKENVNLTSTDFSFITFNVTVKNIDRNSVDTYLYNPVGSGTSISAMDA